MVKNIYTYKCKVSEETFIMPFAVADREREIEREREREKERDRERESNELLSIIVH